MEFLEDYNKILEVAADGPTKTLSYKRLKILNLKYDLHVLLNGSREAAASQNDPRDFGNVMKVDTHIHLSAAMTSKHLLDFIRNKLRNASTDVVLKTGTTLAEVFNKLCIDIESFTLNSLDTRADNTFQRFDHFNAKYNPFGKSELREVFLKSNNAVNGRYYAELTQELFDRLARSKYVAAEYRVSIYGSSTREWDELAKWVVDHKLYSDRQRWLIQIPRIYTIFRRTGTVKSFQDLLKNIFAPLFEVSVNPASHPELHAFLHQVSGFDSVDDESKPERKFDNIIAQITPDNWTSEENPPYGYYSYYFWANIVALNTLRASRGLKTFDFRPHCGESGDVDHLASSYLIATNISHGINLDKAIPLQYLYYLSQVGIAVSPLSNNSLFLEYALNPFPKFFKRGLNVSLSTDDPLQFHHTEQPLIEEYATAAQKWELSDGDLSEIARNSILQSGFEHAKKTKWLGPRYLEPGVSGNDISFSNVTDIRIGFRQDNLDAELDYLKQAAKMAGKKMDAIKDVLAHTSSVSLSQPYFDENEQEACHLITKALEARNKYILPSLSADEHREGPDLSATAHYFRIVKGVIHVFEGTIFNGKQFIATEPMITDLPSYPQFERDMDFLVSTMKHPNVSSFAGARLRLLDNKFGFHTLLNGNLEKELMRYLPTDFAHVTKVDNHVRLQHSMLAKHFIKFVKQKVRNHGKDVVMGIHGTPTTLESLYSILGIPIDNLTVDALYVRTDSGLTHLDASSLGTFLPNSEGTAKGAASHPIPTSDETSFALWHLYNLFLMTDNELEGRYFGELAKEVLVKRERNPQILHEFRLLLLGRSPDEWTKLARWLINNNLLSPTIQWIIEIPQSYWYLRKNESVQNLQEYFDNIFHPLLEVSRDPTSHPELARVLPHISAIYIPPALPQNVEDKVEHISPLAFTKAAQPPLPYLMYFFWANIYSLNTFRKSKRLPCIALRATTDSSAHSVPKASLWALCNTIHNADLVLRHSTVLTYLCYLVQLPLTVSPLASNTRTSRHYSDSLFMSYFRQGLMVSLSSDNPLQLHMTNEPLSEEYAIASHMWKLSICDLSEIARSSVLLSGFSFVDKCLRIGDNFYLPFTGGNDKCKTNVPDVRLAFRETTLQEELGYLSNGTISRTTSVMDLQKSVQDY